MLREVDVTPVIEEPDVGTPGDSSGALEGILRNLCGGMICLVVSEEEGGNVFI